MTRLPARRLPRPVAPAAAPRQLGWPITGRRLVAVVAGLLQTGFQFRHAGGQGLELLAQGGMVLQHWRQLIRMGRQQLLDPSHHGVCPAR
jgi:hypothetical protein